MTFEHQCKHYIQTEKVIGKVFDFEHDCSCGKAQTKYAGVCSQTDNNCPIES